MDRVRLPDLRPSITKKSIICTYKCYITVSFFDDGDRTRPAEVFVKVAKHGSMIAGLLDGMCTILSVSLQYGVPWDALKEKLRHHVFERNEDPHHTSILDGIAQAVDTIVHERRGIVDDVPATEGQKRKGDDPAPTRNDSVAIFDANGLHGGPLVKVYWKASLEVKSIPGEFDCAYATYEDGTLSYLLDGAVAASANAKNVPLKYTFDPKSDFRFALRERTHA